MTPSQSKEALVSVTAALLVITSCVLPAAGQTDEGNSHGAPCVFPFIYRGVSYGSCIDHDNPKPWCATTSNFDTDRRWGNCRANDLTDLPSFKPMLRNITAFVGDTVRLPCSVNNLGQRAVVWSKKDGEFPLTVRAQVTANDQRLTVDQEGDGLESEWTLVVSRLAAADSGAYGCRVITRTLQLEHVVHLSVLERPVIRLPTVTLGDATSIAVGKGQSFHLQCNATTSDESLPRAMQMPPEVEWFKDGNKVNSAAVSGILITNQIVGRLRISTLFVDKSTMDDGGMYLCRTSEETFAELRVHILNTDKDNKKRGTAIEKPANEKLTASRVKASASHNSGQRLHCILVLLACFSSSAL